MSLRIYDSKSHQILPFEPVSAGKVGIYLCGATVQGSPHIGHIRSAIAFDVLIRWLRRSGYQVTYVRNVTDIDDKILIKSAQASWPWWAWAMRFEREFDAAYQALGIIPPTYEPRATGHIPDQIALVQRLLKAGHAYADGNGNVYFDVHSLPDYGSLTRQKLADMRTTEDDNQIDAQTEAGKRDPRDFALWKAAKDEEPETAKWDSPWGKGRPGWHLECSAMSVRYLGEHFDIHGGGIDLRFPHHENEQAQSHGAGWGFAKYWMHNAWVTVKGEKMSKSLGNSLVVKEILKETPAPILRLALGTTHYRSTVEYSADTLQGAAQAWEKFSGQVKRFAKVSPQIASWTRDALTLIPLPAPFTQALDEDLNIAGGLAVIHETIKQANQDLSGTGSAPDASGNHSSSICTSGTSVPDPALLPEGEFGTGRAVSLDPDQVKQEFAQLPSGVQAALQVRAMLDVLGLDPLSEQWSDATGSGTAATGDSGALQALSVLVESQLEQRKAARAEKNWAQADAIRDQLKAAGIVVEDSAQGASWHL